METITTKTGNTIKIFAKTIEYQAYAQIKSLGNFEAYENSKIRIMPDCHAGMGCTIGTTMEIKDKVTPNLVGVDIGCGMFTVKLKEKYIDVKKLDEVINTHVPSGPCIHKKAKAPFDFSALRCKKEMNLIKASRSIGSLGGGNHFIEVGKSTDGTLYLVIHSGSRGIGNKVAKHYQLLAWKQVNEMKTIKENLINKLTSEGRINEIKEALKKLRKPKANSEFAYLTGSLFDDYMNDMQIIQKYAELNRRTMADIILKYMSLQEESSFQTIHNYIDFKRMILRKGAVRAEEGEMILIPINMRDGSLICVGKGNSDWNYSAPHGAGRLMSRRKAKRNLSLKDFRKQMKGIYSTSVSIDTLDEAPEAYKTMNEIIETIGDTVKILERIKPIYNFKAH
ncbi:MAG TPA: RNA-splicing ligase RtcB [Lutibacter sp.]|nr:RNA-splicing ligase RtcB [Lutibacter sp.]